MSSTDDRHKCLSCALANPDPARLTKIDVLSVYQAVRNAHLRRELGFQVRRAEPETETSPATKVWATEELQGTVIFEERNGRLRITLDDVPSGLEQASAFANEATPARADRTNYKAFAKTRRHLRRFEERLWRHLSEFAAFWTERNLALALVQTYGYSVDGGTIVVEGPPRRVLGMEG